MNGATPATQRPAPCAPAGRGWRGGGMAGPAVPAAADVRRVSIRTARAPDAAISAPTAAPATRNRRREACPGPIVVALVASVARDALVGPAVPSRTRSTTMPTAAPTTAGTTPSGDPPGRRKAATAPATPSAAIAMDANAR